MVFFKALPMILMCSWMEHPRRNDLSILGLILMTSLPKHQHEQPLGWEGGKNGVNFTFHQLPHQFLSRCGSQIFCIK